MLGPLVNPSNPTHHYTGTYNLPLARLYNYLFQQDESQYVVVHSLDGYDEISLTGACKWYGSGGEFIFNPDDWNLTVLNQESLFGGNTIKEAATIFVRVIEGKGTEAQTNAVIANAAAALYCLHPENTIQHHLDIARETLESGKAFQTFKNTIG